MAEETQPIKPTNLTIKDMSNAYMAINLAAQRGAYTEDDMKFVSGIYEKLHTFLMDNSESFRESVEKIKQVAKETEQAVDEVTSGESVDSTIDAPAKKKRAPAKKKSKTELTDEFAQSVSKLGTDGE